MQEEKVTADNYDEETFEPIGSTAESVEPEFVQKDVEDADEPTEDSAEADQAKVDPEEKSIAHFQRVAQEKHDLAMQKDQALREKDAEVKALSEKIAEIEKRFQPKQEELLPPKPPESDDPLDEIRYLKEVREYDRKVDEQRWKVVENERQALKAQKEKQEHRRSYMGAFMDAGASADEAAKAYDFGFSEVSADPGMLLQFMRWYNGQRSQQTKQTNTINAPLPAGVSGGEEEKVIDPNEAFNSQMEKYASRRGSWV